MKKRLVFALLLMGFTSLVIQVLLIREFLICFYGNELTIGLILGNWIALEAIGSSLFSRLSQKNKKPLLFYCVLQLLIALYLPCSIYLIRIVKNFIPLTSGEGIGIIPIFISSLFILVPLSIFDGAQFPFGCRIWNDFTKKPAQSVGSVYILEAVGFIIAGPIFTYLFITKLNSFQIVFILSILNLLSGLFLAQKEIKFFLKKPLVLFFAVMIGINIAVLSPNISQRLNNFSLKKQWKGYNLVDSQNSIYGNLAVTKQQEQYTFFSDGLPIITTPVPDIVTNEGFINFGMLSHPDPKEILIIGGGAGGPISEILKSPVKHLDYAELDPLLIKMVKKYSSVLIQKELTDPKLSIKITDGARYIKTTSKLYDIVFINLPFPTTLQLNRFYTKDFFGLTKKILKDNKGILVFKLPGSLSYLNAELTKLNLCILNTLNETFPFVKVVPGDFNLYLASASDFNIGTKIFTERLKKRNISADLLTPFYIQDRLDNRWSDWFYSTLTKSPNVKKNTSFLPAGLFYALSYWNSLFSPHLEKFFKVMEKINLKLLIFIIFLLSLFIAGRRKLCIPYAIFSTGMLAMAYELILIFIYQSFYGYVYHHIALLITSFMAGLTLGGWFVNRRLSKIKNKKFNFILFELGLIVFSVAILPVFFYLGKSKLDLSFVFYILSVVSGFLVGSEFPLANSLYQIKNSARTAGILYGVDLFGSWIGALIVSVVLIPVVGLVQTCIFLAILKLSSLILISISGV